MVDKYLSNRLVILYIIPFAVGSLTVLSFQPFNSLIINFFVLPTLFYLIIFITKKSKSTYRKKPYKKNLFIFGTSFGFGFYLSGIHWITYSLTFDESLKIFIPLGLIFIPLFLSLFYSLIILLIGPFLSLNFQSIFLFSGVIAISDFIRSKILTGFPWNLWAYSFSGSTEIIQVTNKLGLFAFNLIAITIFMIPSILFLKEKVIKKILSLIFSLFLVFSFYIYGNHSINKNKQLDKSNYKKENIKVVSPNFKLEYGLNENDIESRLNKLIRYSEPDKTKKTLFVWPEGVFSGYSFEEIFF